ncbi:DUF6479 family protein [Streptomyces showdoensis]|uniref:Uncharacterized protein n=1 Tax=Streptomyces showdoensis TaxID=68268 RepID=A0A2P2GHP7_STREW|nr:DUF6479 family protein [Streptomyces showdoensis]KKZ71046.1 hypothetical protein VO63_25775 [Streptomyces showdoensis]
MTAYAGFPTLASAGSNGVLFAVVIGVVVVAVLLGAFWWGSRRVARRRASAADASRADTRAARGSWSTPDGRDGGDTDR